MFLTNNKEFPYKPDDVVKLVVSAYDLSLGIFKNKVNAEDLVPKTTKKNQVQFLFWVIQMDYAIRSSALYKNANILWSKNPHWINAEYLINLKDENLKSLIKDELRPRYSNEIFIRFKKNSEELLKRYKGDAINIINTAKSAKDLLKRILVFRGFGPKTGNFLTRTYIDLMKLNYIDINEVFQPVDTHDVRLTYEWGFIKSKEMTSSNIKNVKLIWNKACKDAGVSWIKFDKAL